MRKSRGESAMSHKALLSWEVITGAPRKAKFTTSEGLCEFNVLSFTKISYGLHLFSKFHVLPVSIFSLTEEVLWGWKFSLCCNSANNGMRVWVWNLSPLATEDKVWFEGRHRSFQLIYSDLNLGISLPEVIFFSFFVTLLAATSQSCYALSFEQSVYMDQIYGHSQSAFVLGVWSGVFSSDICVSLCCIVLQANSTPFNQWK